MDELPVRHFFTYEDIDNAIDEWHDGDSELPLHEYLGMTLEEYTFFVELKHEI